MGDYKYRFRDNLQAKMEELNVSPAYLALLMGAHRQQINKWLTGEDSSPRASTVRRIARALGCSADDLIGTYQDDVAEIARQER